MSKGILLKSPLLFLFTNLANAYIVLSVSHSLKHFTNNFFYFPTSLQGRYYYYPHFTHKETEALSLDIAQVHTASK